MKSMPSLTCLRMLLLLLGLQKAFDALATLLHPPAAEFALRILGIDLAREPGPLEVLLMRLWGGASLAWAYLLLRSARDPRSSRVILEGSVLGFLTLGVVALCTPMTSVRMVGVLFMLEAILLWAGRVSLDRDPSHKLTCGQQPMASGQQRR